MKSQNNKIVKCFLETLVLFVLWSFIFTYTKTSWSSFVYIFLIVIFLMGVLLLLLDTPKTIPAISFLWLPFIAMSIVGNLQMSNYESAIYYFSSAVILIIAKCINWEKVFPKKIFLFSGILMIIGILFQMSFPTVYNMFVANFFKNTNDILYWAKHDGYAGFTYQLGMTAIILAYFMCLIWFKKYKNNKYRYIFFAISVMFVFLTGKRAIAVLVLFVPLIIALIGGRLTSRRLINIFSILIVVGLACFAFITNAELFTESKVLGRFATMIADLEMGNDISSNRLSLYSEAFMLMKEKSLFGIGLGQFKELSVYKTDVHNTYLQVLCEQGILGFILYVFPLLANLFYCAKVNKIYDNYLLKVSLFIQLFFVFYGMTGNVSANEFCYVIYFMAISMTIGLSRQLNNEQLENAKKMQM